MHDNNKCFCIFILNRSMRPQIGFTNGKSHNPQALSLGKQNQHQESVCYEE